MTPNAGMLGPTGKMGTKVPGHKIGQIQNFTPEQMKLFQQMFGQVSPESFTSRLAMGDESGFEEMEAPALRQFSQLQGNIGSRFSGMGMGAQRSSGFQNTLGQASSDFAQQLQSRRMQLRQEALKDLMGFSNQILGQKPYESVLTPKQEKTSPWGGLAGAGVGAVGGFLAGGPIGALSGASLGYNLASGKGSSGSFQSTPNWDLGQYALGNIGI